jgi:hypothetical protein
MRRIHIVQLRVLAIVLFIFLFGKNVEAQFLAPYMDIMEQVYVFNDGNTQLIEPLPLKEYKVGKNAMLYSSPQGRLKAFHQGQVYTLLDVTPTYFATDNFIGYYNFGNLVVLYQNKFISLDRLAEENFWVSDSMVVWISNLGDTRAFYNGETYTLEQWTTRSSCGHCLRTTGSVPPPSSWLSWR